VGQSWWDCADDMCYVWGRFGGIVKTVCDVWGRVGGIVQTVCAICLELRTIKYLSGSPQHFCTYSGTRRLVYEATNQVRVGCCVKFV
jgi:hypothetical protein